MSPPDAPPRAVVFGCAGPALGADERAFFHDADPLGFILFARNCEEPGQVRDLTAALREAVGRADAPVLIDQEGGTVMRLRPPHWHGGPDAARFGTLYRRAPERALAAAGMLGRLFGAELAALGIDVDCAPVLDLGLPETTAAIGPRAWSGEPAAVAALGGAMAEGLLAEGVLPVAKHMPGHGRARVDSHRTLPRVDAPAETLAASDFAPFRALAHLPLGMTAHVVYEALDPERPATVSRRVIHGTIRCDIGFEGFLFSDDIAMSALSGSPGERAAAALAAGCDAALHCTGRLDEMRAVAAAAGPLGEASAARWARAAARRDGIVGGAGGGDSPDALAAELDYLLNGQA